MHVRVRVCRQSSRHVCVTNFHAHTGARHVSSPIKYVAKFCTMFGRHKIWIRLNRTGQPNIIARTYANPMQFQPLARAGPAKLNNLVVDARVIAREKRVRRHTHTHTHAIIEFVKRSPTRARSEENMKIYAHSCWPNPARLRSRTPRHWCYLK